MQKGLFSKIAVGLGNAFGDIADLLGSNEGFQELLNHLGWSASTLPASYRALATNAMSLRNAVNSLVNEPNYEEIKSLLTSVKGIINAIETLSETPTGVSDTNFLADFKNQLIELLVVEGLKKYFTPAYHLLSVIGLVSDNIGFMTNDRGYHKSKTLDIDRAKRFLADPTGYLDEYFNWNDGLRVDVSLLKNIVALAKSLGVEASMFDKNTIVAQKNNIRGQLSDSGAIYLPIRHYVDNESKDLLSISFQAKAESMLSPNDTDDADDTTTPVTFEVDKVYSPEDQVYDKLVFGIVSDLLATPSIAIGDNLSLSLADLSNAINFEIGDNGISFYDDSNSGLSNLALTPAAVLDYHQDSSLIFIGEPNKTRLQADSIQLALNLYGKANEKDVQFELKAVNSKLVIQGSEGDSFISKVLPNSTVPIPFGVSFSFKKGLQFNGGNAFQVKSTANKKIGPVSFNNLTLGISSGAQHDVKISAHAGIVATLGPVEVTIDNVGVSFGIQSIKNPKSVSLGFDLPTGVGIAVDSDVVKGGGFLSIDPAAHRYAGVASLSVRDKLTLNAVGILLTQLPNQQDGYSLLLLITAQFTPIQLGLGFTLNGVGGLVGINRTINIPYLRQQVQAGNMDRLLFPANILDNPTAVLSTVESSFPAAEGRYVFGIMAKVGWGTPTLITLDAALILELPSPVRLALLGVLQAILPDKDHAIVKLRADFLGAVDFGAKKISFDASLTDSRILYYALTGDMAFRLYNGNDPVFVLTAGGFHPAFQPPTNADLPTLRRMRLALADSDDLRIILTNYLAVTSNTVQFGSRLDVYVDLPFSFYLEGFMGFDVLFQFHPFRVSAYVGAGVAIKRKGSTKLSLRLELNVTGPSPWHVVGEASFRVLGFKIKARIDRTFGSGATAQPLPAVNVHNLFLNTLNEASNWETEQPAGSTRNATVLRTGADDPSHLVVDPSGSLVFRQKLVPLQYNLEKFSNGNVAGGNRFDITGVEVVGTTLPNATLEPVTDFFAAEQFRRMTDAQKLSSPSFQLMRSGYRLKGLEGFAGGDAVQKIVDYEQIVVPGVNAPTQTAAPGDFTPSADLFRKLAKNSRINRAYEQQTPSARVPAPVSWSEDAYAVVSARDLNLYTDADESIFPNEAQATAFLQDQVARKAVRAGELLVVPAYQLELA